MSNGGAFIVLDTQRPFGAPPILEPAGSGNTPPVWSAIPLQTVAVGATLILGLAAFIAELDGDNVSYSLPAAVAGASVDSSTGVLTYTPPSLPTPNPIRILVRATDDGTPAESSDKYVVVNVTGGASRSPLPIVLRRRLSSRRSPFGSTAA